MLKSKTYWGIYISATRLLTFDFYASLLSLIASFLLPTGLCIVAQQNKWWGLDVELKKKLGYYLYQHAQLMRKSKGDALVRDKFINLENKFSALEAQFDEMRTCLGG